MKDTKDIELEAACSLTERQARKILFHNKFVVGKKKDIVFNFNQYDLLSYLRRRPELCDKILQFSYDKRCSSSTFIEENNGSYRVGWFEKDREQVKTFDKLYEATTDFVLFSWSLGRLEREEYRLPKEARDKAIENENEFGWRQQNFKEIIEVARQIPMAIIGGQVQYVFNDGTCELYWLSYNSKKRQENEKWLTYCNRTASEVTEQFDELINETDFDKEAVSSFEFLKQKKEQGINIEKHKLFIIYFDDSETDIWNK